MDAQYGIGSMRRGVCAVMRRFLCSRLARLFALCTLVPGLPSARAQAPAELDGYDLVWRTPSADASGSMPIGNGEVGCNVWCEPDGRVCFYVSRTDSFSESSRLLKLGKVTIHARRPVDGEPFEQRLCLREGCIRVAWGAGERRVALELFVDAGADVIRVVGESARDEQLVLEGETWRTQEKRLEGGELDSSWTMRGAPADVRVVESADLGTQSGEDALGFCHRNASSVAPFTFARQGLAGADAPPLADALLGRTYGLLLDRRGLTDGHMRDRLHPVLITPRARRFELAIAAPCLQAESVEAWTRAANGLLRASDAATARARTGAWWNAFWDRSYVFVRGDAATSGVPTNAHPLRIGVDSSGGNVFHGTIADVKVLDGDELVYAAASGAVPRTIDALKGRVFAHALHLEASVTQDAAHPVGRILDKLTAGASDGFLFDTHPGHALRLIVGERILIAENALPAGETHRVAASFDPASGRLQLFRDGKLVASSAEPADAPPPSRLTQAWLLQRWVQACGGRGHFPIKFNGSIFTVEPRFSGGPEYDADWRKWGDSFWWQNTRLPYYPMLAQGDFEMQEPLFRLYRDTLPVAKERVRAWYGGEKQGAYWPETMTPFGAHANGDYGWERKDLPASKVLCPWWEYARNQGLELVALMLDRWDYERDPRFLASELVPLAEPVLAWFESAYPRDEHGTLRLTPTQAIETYWNGVEDDMPTVAGLRWVLPRLVALPKEVLPDALRERWAKLAAALPPLPRRTQDGIELLAPAAKYDPARQNCESPELYAVFPFRHFGLGKPGLELARASFARRVDRFTNGWPQDGQDAALLGLVDEARTNVLAKARNDNKAQRFPAMWGPNFDWCPDQDHGSNLLDTTERMLLQCEGDTIRVLPCWPTEWDVHCKLHAPQRTVIELVWRAGKLETLAVAPRERAKDVVVGGG